MGTDGDGGLLDHALVPIASKEDGRRTAEALRPRIPDRITLLFVVEKGGGAPDQLSVKQAELLADDSFEAFEDILPADEERIAYGEDVIETIFEVASDVDASSVAFHSRGGGRLLHLLTGDTTRKLVTQNEVPVIALPSPPQND